MDSATPLGRPHTLDSPPRYLLVSQVFPPAVGGSGVLLDNVYSRLTDAEVVAVVDAATVGAVKGEARTSHVLRTTIDPQSWGLADPRAWPNQLRLARLCHQWAGRGLGIVHCGRAQPEGISAFLASLMPGGPRYVFWAHGEDISAARSSRHFSATMRVVYGRAAAAIANSRNTARLIESTGWLNSRVHIVYPGVDASRFHPEADDGTLRRELAPDGGLVLLSVARLHKRKGHDLVLKALPALRRDFPHLKYVIVGDGPERDALTALSSELGISDAVLFRGEITDAQLPAYFAACDIFLLPTRVEAHDFEGFGIVYLEAAAAGKPAIGGRNGGVPEAVTEGETGLLVSGEQVEELRAAIARLASSEELRRRLGNAGMVRARRDFTWERAADMIAAIHRDVSRGIRTPPPTSPF
jgi:phosphatidylinositol alpha-1,6-mannosyltransferase